jgi:hypothetical protein
MNSMFRTPQEKHLSDKEEIFHKKDVFGRGMKAEHKACAGIIGDIGRVFFQKTC